MADMNMGPAPTRSTSESSLNDWNVALRSSPAYQKFLESIGQGHGRPTKLSRDQQSQLEHMLAGAGVPIPSGMHIDQAGNLNQKNRLLRNVGIGAGLTAAALATAGAAGFGPLAGAMGGGAGAGGAAGAAALPTATAGVPAGLGTGVSLSGLGLGSAALPAAVAGVPAGVGTAAALPSLPRAATAASGAGSGGKLMKSLLNPNVLQAAGQGLGAIAQTNASNRGTQLDAMMEADKMKILQDRDRRDSENDMLRKFQITDYIKRGGASNNGPVMSNSGKPFTSFDFGVRPATDEAKARATSLEEQLMQRLNNPPQLSDYNSKMEPGGVEKTLDWVSPIVSGIATARGAQQYQPPANAPRRY